MALRRPVFYDEQTQTIQAMNAAQLTAIRNLAVYLHGRVDTGDFQVPTISVVSSGGTLGNISDTRKQAGAYRKFTNRFPNESETAEPGTVTVNYNRFNVNNYAISEPTDTQSRRYPVYLDGDNNLRAMTEEDFFDTFITQAIDILTDGDDRPGIYKVAGTTPSNHTLVSNTPVYVDTRANTGAYSSGGIPEALDQPTTINNYYLYRGNQTWDLTDITQGTFDAGFKRPLFIDSTNNVHTPTVDYFENLLLEQLKYRASNGGVGNRIRYNINGSGNQRGTAMVNTILNGNGAYRTRYVNANDYRAQEHPNGSAVTAATYTFKINRE